MVKFGKEFRFVQKNEWKGKYLNYKKLKQYINCYISQEYLQKKSLTSSEFDFPKKHSKSEIVKHFISLLDHEIKMFYLFYNKEEKLLHKDINTRLYSNDDYPTLDKDEYINKFNDLHTISSKALDLAKFVYYNFKALIKIIKKFDKKYLKERVSDHIKYKYIQYKLEEQNSDILDMYKFKIIDEVCALVENLVKDLHENYKRNKHLFKDNNNNNDGNVEQHNNNNDQMLIREDNNKLQKNFSDTNSIKEIINNIQSVDQYSLQIKTLLKPWDSFLKISNTINNQLYATTKEINVSPNNNNNDEHNNNNNQIELDGSNLNVEGFNQLESSHLSKTLPFLFKRKHSIMTNMLISRENKANANIVFIHTFLYFFSYSIQIPYNLNYLNNFNKADYYTGLFNSMAPIGALISFLYSIVWSFYSTKKPTIVALLFLLIGNVCCTLSQHYNTFYLLLIGRFVIGLGCNRIGNKMYLYNYIPKQDLNKYISCFHVVTLLGLSCGFLVNIPLVIYNEHNHQFNENLGTLICSVVSVFVFFYALLTLTEAFNPEFFPTTFSLDGKETTINRKTVLNTKEEHKPNEGTISMTLNESIRKDTHMIYDINEKLDQFNEQNEYVDNNLVAKSVRQLTKNEKKQLRFLKGSFYVFVIIVFVSKVINEFILINSPLYLKTFETFNSKVLSLLLGVSFVIVLIIEYVIFITKKCLKDRTSLLILLVLITILSLLCILQYWHKNNDWEYYVGMVGLIILSNFLEKTASSFFAKIISNDYKMCCMQGNSVINVATNFGRIIGAAIPLLLIVVEFENMNKGTFFAFMILSFVAFVIALCFYEDLRVKPISRILEKEKNSNLQIPNDI